MVLMKAGNLRLPCVPDASLAFCCPATVMDSLKILPTRSRSSTGTGGRTIVVVASSMALHWFMMVFISVTAFESAQELSPVVPLSIPLPLV